MFSKSLIQQLQSQDQFKLIYFKQFSYTQVGLQVLRFKVMY